MIEIIKPGNINKMETTCLYCGCIYRYDVSDLSYSDGLTTYTYTTPHTICPTCGRMNNVAIKQVNLDKIYSGDELNV